MKEEDTVGPLPAPTAPVAVFWDLENCHVPSSVEAAELVGHIFTALRQRGLSGVIHIQAYADTSILPVEVNSGLSSTGVNLLHVARGRKEASDKAILVDMVLWALDHPPPAHFLLISGDRDFSNVLHRLKFRQYNIMLATTITAKPTLMNAASLVWDWASLARGQQLDPVPKAKRQAILSPPPPPPLGTGPQYGQRQSWGEEESGDMRQRGGVWQGPQDRADATGWGGEEPRRVHPPDASWDRPRDARNERGGDSQGRGIPSAVRERLGQIVREHPDGCSVGEVLQALRVSGFKINWVGMGFPNLLALLKALPDSCVVDEDVRTKEGYKVTRIYPARQPERGANGAFAEERSSNAGYGQGYSNQGPRVAYKAEPILPGPRLNGPISPREYDMRPPISSSLDPGRGRHPPPYSQGGPGVPLPDPRGPPPPCYQGAPLSSNLPPSPASEFSTLVAVVWELQRQGGGQPPDQRQVISMLRNEHGEMFASLGGYGPYETPFKYIEAAQRAGYLDLRPGPAPGSVALALTPKAGEHAYDFPQNAPPSAPPILPRPPPPKPSYSAPPAASTPVFVKQAKPAPPPPESQPRIVAEPRVVVSADPPEAEELSVPLPSLLLRGTAASLRKDLIAPTEANLRARVIQLMRPQSVMAGGEEVKQWFIPDAVWDKAIKAAVDEGALVPSTVANREILLPQGMPSWRFVDPHFTGWPYSTAQWGALEECIRDGKGRAAIEGSYTRYAAARAVQQVGSPILKALALGQVINLLQLAVKKGWIQPGPNWRPARVMLPAAAIPQQPQAPVVAPVSLSSEAAPVVSSAPVVVKAAPAPASSAYKKKEPPAWLAKLRKWLPLFLQQIGPKGYPLAPLKGTFKQASGITITEADVKEAGFLKFSQMLASMTDVCTMHMVLYHDKNKDYVLHPAGWTPPKDPPSEAPAPAPAAAAPRSAGPALPVSTFFPKEVEPKESKSAPTVGQVKQDMAQLLAEVLPKHPEGLNAGGLKILFAERFGYQLNHEALGFPKLRDLLQALPASCRLTFHPYIMIHPPAGTTRTLEPAVQENKVDRKVWSPVKRGVSAGEGAPKEAQDTGSKPEVSPEKGRNGTDDSESVGPVGRLSLLPGADLGSSKPSNAEDGVVSVAPVGALLGSFVEIDTPAAGQTASLEAVAVSSQQLADEVIGAAETESTRSSDVGRVETAGTTLETAGTPSEAASAATETAAVETETGGMVNAVEAPALLNMSTETIGQGSPILAEATPEIPVSISLVDIVEATPHPPNTLTWSPDSLATPTAETPDRTLVLPHETTAYAVKPAELRSRLAREAHASIGAAVEEMLSRDGGSPAPDTSPGRLSEDSMALPPSDDTDSHKQSGGGETSSRQSVADPLEMNAANEVKVLDSMGVSDSSKSDGVAELSDAESGSTNMKQVSSGADSVIES